MKLTQSVQEQLVSLLCYDAKHAKMVRALVPARMFDLYYRNIAMAAEEYLEKYDKPPGDHTYDLVDQIKAKLKGEDEEREAEAERYDRLYGSLQATRKVVNPEFAISKATTFADEQQMRAHVSQVVDIMESGEDLDEQKIGQARSLLDKATKRSIELFDVGTLFTDASKSLSWMNDEWEAFPTGIPDFDRLGLGPGRGKLWVIGASPKKGKSWALLHLGKMAILHGLKVCYVSLELSEPMLCKRAFQSFYAMTKRESIQLSRMSFERDELGRFLSMEPRRIKRRPHLQHPNISKLLVKRLKQWHRPPLLFKKFPMRSITPKDLEAYLGALEGKMGWKPDLLIVDYADLFKIDTKNYRHDVVAVYQELRAIGEKLNCAVASATQLNRLSTDVREADERHLAEAFEKFAVVDVGLTYNQTKDEREMGLARLHVAVGREDESKFTVCIAQNYAMGQFAFESVRMASNYWSLLEGKDGEDDEGDEDS